MSGTIDDTAIAGERAFATSRDGVTVAFDSRSGATLWAVEWQLTAGGRCPLTVWDPATSSTRVVGDPLEACGPSGLYVLSDGDRVVVFAEPQGGSWPILVLDAATGDVRTRASVPVDVGVVASEVWLSGDALFLETGAAPYCSVPCPEGTPRSVLLVALQ
jgi:outer membrane protein assembly factor BamB